MKRNHLILLAGSILAWSSVSLAQVDAEHRPVEQVSGTSFSLMAEPFERATLTVTGPDGYRLQQTFAAEETIAVDLLGAGRQVRDGQEPLELDALADGRYRYELTLMRGETDNTRVSGVLFARNGVAQRREEVRSRLADVRRELLGQTDSEPGLHTKTSATLVESDWIYLLDTSNDGRTSLFLESNDPIASEFFRLSNDNGDFGIFDSVSYYSPGPRFFIDRSNPHVGLGTSTPQGSLHITDPAAPEVALQQTGGDLFEVEAISNRLTLKAVGIPMFRMESGGNFYQMVLDSSGNVGINDVTPDAMLTVTGNSTDEARILVDQTADPDRALRNMLSLENNGTVRVEYRDTSAGGATWFTKTSANKFFITKSGQGNLFVIDSSGNVDITGSLNEGSARASKTAFAQFNVQEVLSRVASLPLSTWQYRKDPDGVRHLGPMAEDFHEAFGLGRDPEHIAAADRGGVALAAIQALHENQLQLQGELERERQLTQTQEREIADLSVANTELRTLLGELRTEVRETRETTDRLSTVLDILREWQSARTAPFGQASESGSVAPGS